MTVNGDRAAPSSGRLIAIGVVAGDLSPYGIARFAEVSIPVAAAAVEDAQSAGIIVDGRIDESVAAELVAHLDRSERAAVHAATARYLLTAGPEHLPQVLHHIRQAGTLGVEQPMVTLADQSGRLSLSLGDYQAAHDLLLLADELDSSGEAGEQGRRLCDLASATDGLGRVEEARQYLARAFSLGELTGDAALVAHAAVLHTLPVDWYAGDPRTTAFLQRAESMEQTFDAQVAIRAARALAEIRIPLTVNDGEQVAWVTRPTIAQPLADEALKQSESSAVEVQCLAHIAWRTTHRAPEFLERRREVSARTLLLAQQLRHPGFQVEGAVWSAVDALEAGDRGRYDEALTVAQWVSRTDGNPRLRWRAVTLSLGAAVLDGDADTAERLRAEVAELRGGSFSPSPSAVTLFFVGQEMIGRDDPEELATLRLPDDMAELASPIGRAAAGYIWARSGEPERGVEFARRAFRQLDGESSYLLLATRVAAVAVEACDTELAREAHEVLEPWADRVAVDSNGWWCDGPVAMWLAMLEGLLGDEEAAATHRAQAEVTARRLNDVRSMRRLDGLRSTSTVVPSVGVPLLTERERAVLAMIAAGATNRTISAELRFSLSTIRHDTIAIYRKLGVSGRSDAVARALALGLV